MRFLLPCLLRLAVMALLFAGAVAAPLRAQSEAQSTQQSGLEQGQTDLMASQRSEQRQPSEDDFLLLQLVIDQYTLTLDVRGYRIGEGVCLDLADTIQALDLPIRLDKRAKRASGWLFSEDQRFLLDRVSGEVLIGDLDAEPRRIPLASEIYDTAEGWCVDIRAFSQWFGIDFVPDLYNSLIRLETETELPFIQAIERESRAARLRPRSKTFDLSQFPNKPMDYKLWRDPSLDVVIRGGVRSGGGSREGINGRAELFAAGEAFGASTFLRLGTNEEFEPASLRLRAYRKDPEANLLGPLEATHAAIGDVETLAGRLTGQTAIGRGAFISNQPLGRINRFSATTLRGVLPAGWDAELYRNGQLIAFQNSRADGRYEFVEVELFYGRNDLEVVLYGPQGQIRRETTSFPVGFNQIEPGETFYWAGVLQNNRDLFQLENSNVGTPQEWRWGVGIERGLDKRTSALLGAQSLVFAAKRRSYLEGALTRSFGQFQVELGGAHELGAGNVVQINTLGRIGTINFGANALVTDGEFVSEFVPGELDYRTALNVDSSVKLGKTVFPVQANLSHSRLQDGSDLNEYLLTTSLNAGRVALSAQFSHLEEMGGTSNRDRRDTRIRLLANTRFKNWRLRGNAAFLTSGPDKGLETVTARVDKTLDERSDFQGQIDYAVRNDEFRLTGGYTRRFDKLLLRADTFVTTRGGVGANLQIAFSLGPKPSGRSIRVTQAKLARGGQAAVTVFRDDNGDGLRDPSEQLLSDVMVEAGLRSTDAVTDDEGRAIVDELLPFQPVLVGIDESTLADPFLAPAGKGVVITPRPGVMAQIQLPIAPTGEIEGMLLGADGAQKPGVPLELVDASGRVAAETVSEFDGFFLFQRVPYGEYRLRISDRAAEKIGVEAFLAGGGDDGSPLRLGRDNEILRLGEITLRDADARDEAPLPEPDKASGPDKAAPVAAVAALSQP